MPLVHNEWEKVWLDEMVIGGMDVLIGPKTGIVILFFCAGVDPAALTAVERQLFPIIRNDVLPQFRTDLFQQVAEMTNDREIVGDGMSGVEEYVPNDHQ